MSSQATISQHRPFVASYVRNLYAGIVPKLRLEPTRLWEVDTCRGFALGMMLVYHLVWNLARLGNYDISVHSGFWSYWQMATAGLFTLIVGVSLSLSKVRGQDITNGKRPWARQFGRSAALLTWAMVISLVTYLVFGSDGFVRFGILHLIGVSTILAYPLVRYRWPSLILGLFILGLGVYLDRMDLEVPWLVWLIPTTGGGVDNAPLLPMLAPVLIGVFLGNVLFPRGVRRFTLPAAESLGPVRVLRYLGQNSLLFYLWHQPVLVGLLLLLGVADWPLDV